MFFHPKSLKSENNNPWFKPWFNILLHTQSIVCATVGSQCLEYLGYITLCISRLLLKFLIWETALLVNTSPIALEPYVKNHFFFKKLADCSFFLHAVADSLIPSYSFFGITRLMSFIIIVFWEHTCALILASWAGLCARRLRNITKWLANAKRPISVNPWCAATKQDVPLFATLRDSVWLRGHRAISDVLTKQTKSHPLQRYC